MILRSAAVATAALAVAPPTFDSGGPALLIGATEDAVRSASPLEAKKQMDMLVRAGFRGVRITQTWAPGQNELSPDDKKVLLNVATAAQLDGVTVVTSVMNVGSIRICASLSSDLTDGAALINASTAVSRAIR